MEYVVIVEQGETSFGAYVPDLPGCVAVGESRDEAMQLIREAIEFHMGRFQSRIHSSKKSRCSFSGLTLRCIGPVPATC